jgi:acetoacetate decarboxylase
MGFIKSSQEIEQLQQIMSEPQACEGQMLTIVFETDPAFIEQLLPPGLTPGKNPLGSINIGTWARSPAGPYDGASLFVSARAGDVEGDYCLGFYVSNEQASLYGRPMMGEPKKLASIDFKREGNRVCAGITRHNKRILSINAELSDSLGAMELDFTAFYYKHCPAVDGRGLEYDPLLVQQNVRQELKRVEVGTATLELGSTEHDPLGDIPVRDVKTVAYSEGNLFAKVQVLTSVDREAFLPYAFSSYDNWVSLKN